MNNCSGEGVPVPKAPKYVRSRGEMPVQFGLIGCEEVGERECR
jgi:hypothetical protein